MVGANLCDRAVYAHNQLRSRYEGLQKVTWKPELAVTAEATAMKEGTWIGVATVCLDKTVQSTAEQKFSESVLTIAFQEEKDLVFLCDLSEVPQKPQDIYYSYIIYILKDLYRYIYVYNCPRFIGKNILSDKLSLVYIGVI